MASQNGTTFGASIVPIENRHADTHQASIFDSPAITPAASRENLKPSEKDLEAGVVTPLAAQDENPFTSKISVECNKECAMWPSRQTLVDKHKAEKRQRRGRKRCGCGPVVDFWARFNARQKLIIKIVIALLVVGAMIGIGVGISIAVNGTVYVSDDKSSQVSRHKIPPP